MTSRVRNVGHLKSASDMHIPIGGDEKPALFFCVCDGPCAII